MSITPFDSLLFAGMFSDPELTEIFSDSRLLRELVDFERALARAEGRAGVIPAAAAHEINAALQDYASSPAELAEATEQAGVPVPGLVVLLRTRVGGQAQDYVHWGATSQDAMDCALCRQIGAALQVFERRLDAVIETLSQLAQTHRRTAMVGRTRGQQAAPTSFGLKAAGWLLPLVRHRRRLAELRPRVLLLSFGGAVGNLSALGDQALAVEALLAEELGLRVPAAPWHAQRDGLAEVAFWAALVAGSLGKIALDVMQLTQSELGELREGGQGRGGSSTMPQKANPTRSEAILAVARQTAALSGQMAQALLHGQERDGAAWQGEWLALGQIFAGCGAALRQAEALTADLIVDRRRMAENLAAAQGLPLAEAASFALSQHLPRAEAQALVKRACHEIAGSRRHLLELLAERCDLPIDWQALADPVAHLGAAEAMIDRVLAEAKD